MNGIHGECRYRVAMPPFRDRCHMTSQSEL